MSVENRRTKENILATEQGSISDITAIALCGGLGKRLEPITGGIIPKPLVQVNGKTLLDYSIDPLYKAGVRKFLFAASHKAELVSKYISVKPYADCARVSVDPPYGVVLALQSALNRFDVTGVTIVLDADAVREGLDFRDAYFFHMQQRAGVTLVSSRVDRPKDSNFVLISNESNETLAIAVNPQGYMFSDPVIKCGMMICSAGATNLIRQSSDIPNSWIGLIEYISMSQNIETYITPHPLLYANVNSPEDLREIEASLRSLTGLPIP